MEHSDDVTVDLLDHVRLLFIWSNFRYPRELIYRCPSFEIETDIKHSFILMQLQFDDYTRILQLFVRLFIDENLDRSIPISKQPKEKIQAILEACDRQFSDFHDRARKRVRTYLKSCRRMRRSKDGNGIDQVRLIILPCRFCNIIVLVPTRNLSD